MIPGSCCLTPCSKVKLKRKTVKDWELSDGTKIPKGTTVCVNDWCRVLDGDFIPNPGEFDPYRMYRKRQEAGKENQFQYVVTSETHLYFGHGRHACPGRFFAVNEVKVLLVLVLMRYDIRMELPAGGLQEVVNGRWHGDMRMPITHGVIQFKSREDAIPEALNRYFWP
jgi:cytochrome P450